ncbi:MAG: pyridoxamine 5'-phosphate oxidase family protein [Alphaproteobacteria bacterium]
MDSAQDQQDSHFHEGELQAQQRLGLRARVGSFARRAIRDHMPDQHRDFYGKLPFVLIGSVDRAGRPWASMVAGRPGFMATPDARTLAIGAAPQFGDPLYDTLRPGADVGLLGIEPATRRRNRLTGKVASAAADGFSITVAQTFGNCPQYIQAREVQILDAIDHPGRERPVHRSDRFDAAARRLIEATDTLFIATAYSTGSGHASEGADVSHRGGRPGFVRLEDQRTFVLPDFSGNNHFNTIGNILLNPNAGFLFADFATGDLLYMTGAAEIDWDGLAVRAFEGAERLIRFRAEEVIRVRGSLPLRFTFGGYAPMLANTGSWSEAQAKVAAERERERYRDYEIVAIEKESDSVSSFHLRRMDGGRLSSYVPGQFLPIRLTLPGEATPVLRTYTLSDAPGGDSYRLSIKREGGEAPVSTFLHDHATPGLRLEALSPRGRFTLERSGDRPVVLISAGIGITPMIAITNALIEAGERTGRHRRIVFIHGARNGREMAFGRHVRSLGARYDALTAHIRFSAPSQDDRLGAIYDSEGRIDIALVSSLLPRDDCDVYLCGPRGFMEVIHDGLIGLGLRPERIRYESFRPATVLRKRDAKPPAIVREPAAGTVKVRFARAGIETTWTRDQGTLLDLAEAAGLEPAFSCRAGVCGSCATWIRCGAVDYLEAPAAPHADDEALICSATPRGSAGQAGCGVDQGLVLDL